MCPNDVPIPDSCPNILIMSLYNYISALMAVDPTLSGSEATRIARKAYSQQHGYFPEDSESKLSPLVWHFGAKE